MLREERRRRLVAAMAEAGIAEMVLYGNAWQGDYLRYAADFGILEGHGIAIVAADGTVELFVDSAVEAERAEAEVPDVKVVLAGDIARAVGARLDRVANHRLGAAPRRFLPRWLADAERKFAHRGRHRAGRPAADAQAAGRDRCDPARREDRRRRLCGVSRGGADRPTAIRAGRRRRSVSAQPRLPGQFHDHRLGRQGRARHDAAIRAPHRGRRPGDDRAHALRRGLLRADLPHRGGRDRRARRNAALSPSIARRWRPASRR